MAAAGAVIVAQENVRKRLSVDNVLHMAGHEITARPNRDPRSRW
jgi:hypothetical protein